MERGYLVAVLAIVATFSGLSHGFRAAEQWSVLHLRHFGTLARSECPTAAAQRAIAKVQTRLRPHSAEEAQLLAEMNVPVPPIPPDVAANLASEDGVPTACARARTMQQAERARHDMLKMQRDMERASRQMRIEPLSIRVQFPPDFQQRIQEQTQAAVRLAREQVKLQIHTRCTNTSSSTDSAQ